MTRSGVYLLVLAFFGLGLVVLGLVTARRPAHEIPDLVCDAGVLEQEHGDGLTVLRRRRGVGVDGVQALLASLGGNRLRRELQPCRALDARLRLASRPRPERGDPPRLA